MSKMFKSKQQLDGKKLQGKLFDVKKDCFSRLRYLKDLLATRELPNEKQFFYNHRSTIYQIFLDAFIQLDASKNRATSKGFGSMSEFIGHDGLNSSQREELELMLYAFEKMLTLLPEVLEQRWQLNSIIFVFRKMLHYTNVLKVRLDGLRLFLMYYQILGERTVRECPQIEVLYAALIPGIVSDLCPNLNPRNPTVTSGPITPVHLSEQPDLSGTPPPPPGSYGPMQPYPNEPFIPMMDHSTAAHLVASPTSLSGGSANFTATFEYKPEIQKYFLEHLLEYSLTECPKIVWPDYRDRRSLRAFEFLMYTFSRIYLPYIFPKMAVTLHPDAPHHRKTWPLYSIAPTISVYKPASRIPTLRRYDEHMKQFFVYQPPNGTQLNPLVQLQAAVILWFTKYLIDKEKNEGRDTLTQGSVSQGQGQSGAYQGGGGVERHSAATSMTSSTTSLAANTSAPYPTQAHSHSYPYLTQPPPPPSNNPHHDQMQREYIRSLLNSKRLYVDLILSLFHETLLLPFFVESLDPHGTNRTPMRNVIKVLRQWIHKDTTSPLPLFLSEASTAVTSPNNSPVTSIGGGGGGRYGTVEDSVGAGLNNFLNVFILSSANVFLLEIPSEQPNILDLQVDVCKRVFNIYRFMVMKVEMERTVWENLVQVLIQVTRSIVSPEIPHKREDTLGGRLAPALFQTLIVTWIKANLNVPVSNQLWEHFHLLVSSLTRWEELIHEWTNTMFILNRVMSRYVFNINLSDLPLEKACNDRKKRITIKAAAAAAAASSGAGSGGVHKSSIGGSGREPREVHSCPDGRQASITSNASSSLLHRQQSTDGSTGNGGLRALRLPYLLANYHPQQSVVRHRVYHESTSVLKSHHHHQGGRPRSLSDSCLVLSVQNALCSIRVPRGGGGSSSSGRNYAPFGGRSKRSSQKSSTRHSPKQPVRQTPNGHHHHHHPHHQRHLPMIDDDDLADDEIVENCTIVDATDMDSGNGHGHHHNHGQEMDYSDASSTVDSTVDGWDPLEMNCFSAGLYGKPRGLYRYYSAEDVFSLPSGGGGSTSGGGRHWGIWSESMSLGQDAGSLKEQPLGFEGSGASSNCSNSVAETMSISGISSSPSTSAKSTVDCRPVLLGGSHRGWNAEITVVLWRRMLGVLGDLNDIPDPTMHKLAFDCLVKITDDFIKMKDNISYLIAMGTVGSLPGEQILLQPSLHYFTAWLFRATTLGNEYKAGKLLAYKLLCIIALHRCELGVGTVAGTATGTATTAAGPPEVQNRDFLILFYLAIKRALSTYDMELTCIIIKYCGQKFFSSALYGSSCLLFDFISAANMIVSSQETKWPRAEALHLLGSLIGFFEVYSNVLILRNTTSAPSLETYKDLKEHVLEILIIASKREQTGLGRSIALCSLGIFLYKEFQSRAEHHRLKEIVNILIAGTRVSVKRPKMTTSSTSTSSPSHVDSTSKFNNRVLCRVACDQLRLQTDHAGYLVEKHPDMARRVIEGLCYTLSMHIEVVQQQNIFKEFKNLLICIQFTLAHWCMAVPKEYLNGTAVSRDFPNFVDAETNAAKSQSEAAGAADQSKPVTLLELVISVFSSIANLNVAEILARRMTERQMEALNTSSSFSDMDTIDYTVNTATLTEELDGHGGGGGGAREGRGTVPPDTRSSDAQTVKRAARLFLSHFLTFIGHFPVPKLRTTSLCALINEADDNPCCLGMAPSDKLELEALNSPNVLMFVVNGSCIVSFVELSADALDSALLTKLTTATSTGPSTSTSSTSLNILKQRPIRIIIRNLLGKFSWNCIALQCPLLPEAPRPPCVKRPEPMIRSIATASNGHYQRSMESNLDDLDGTDLDDDDEGGGGGGGRLGYFRKDSLERVLSDIFETTPECRPVEPEGGSFLQGLNSTAEAVDIVALFTNQHYQERQFQEEQRYRKAKEPPPPVVKSSESLLSSRTPSLTSGCSSSTSSAAIFSDPSAAFQQCRQLIEQTGFLSWEKRSSIELLAKSPAMLRELRHLDAQRCRETHKIAVIYVASGQESKESILSNKSGSRPFEEFVGRLGWEVNLGSHVGFMGGLEANLSTGLTAPYFADSFNEVIFHVSTRLEPVAMESAGPPEVSSTTQTTTTSPERLQLLNKKMRHLGNDEVHIVWSEHYKEYRRNILATEFCDALIVVYPLPATTYPNLFRIQVSRKPEVPFFGPLFSGAVVHRDELAPLVRATAINASRAKRLYMSAYKHYFEERYDTIGSLAERHRLRSTFEEYATRIYAPRYDQLTTVAESPTDSAAASDSMADGFGSVSIEQFLASTGSLLDRGSLSPSNADSISIASTTASLSVDVATPTQPPTTPQFSQQSQQHQHHHHGHAQHQQHGPPPPVPPTRTGPSGASRPTSRSSFK